MNINEPCDAVAYVTGPRVIRFCLLLRFGLPLIYTVATPLFLMIIFFVVGEQVCIYTLLCLQT